MHTRLAHEIVGAVAMRSHPEDGRRAGVPTYTLASSLAGPVAVGPYDLPATLPGCVVADRWLGLHRRTQSNFTVYRFAEHRADEVLACLHPLASAQSAHLTVPSEIFRDRTGTVWAAAPYEGTHAGLLGLERFVEIRGGRLGVEEVRRSTLHLLDAVAAGREAGLSHGEVRRGDVIVTPRGALLVELYGLRSAVGPGVRGDVSDEVRSVAGLAYWLLTGLEADEPRTPVERLVRRIDREFTDWIERALDPLGGFGTVEEAREAFPGTLGEPVRQPGGMPGGPAVRPTVVVRWMRSVLGLDAGGR